MDRKNIWLSIGVIVGALVVLGVTIGPWLWKFYQPISLNSLSDDPARWGLFGDYIGGTLATILAALSFGGLMYSVIQQGQAMRKEWALRNDESYTRQAVVCLERAYSKLNPHKDRHPIRDRLAWLESARLIKSAEELSEKIETDGYRAIYENEREHWRGIFMDTLEPSGLFVVSDRADYFEESHGVEGIDVKSVYTLYRFATWQPDQPDILDKISYDFDLSKIAKKYTGARQYLQAFLDRRNGH
ncbi:hypothetical protein D9M72_352680 [compost metagenome]